MWNEQKLVLYAKNNLSPLLNMFTDKDIKQTENMFVRGRALVKNNRREKRTQTEVMKMPDRQMNRRSPL